MSSSYDYQALYIHVPFCAQRCNYCDFVTEAVTPDDPRLDDYVYNLSLDIASAANMGLLQSIRTVYIGGGTPSYLGNRRLFDLISTISEQMSLSRDTEFTVEANPESLTALPARELSSLGVNRLSLGVQSFVDSELKVLGRIHNANTALEALELVCEFISNVSIDLICGIPGQSISSWRYTLEKALAHGVQHVSVYPLTVEEKTPLAQLMHSGLLDNPDEDLQASLMEIAADVLANAGYERYEVASYALKDNECRHNISYWTGMSYLGLGRGAAGMRQTESFRERLLNNVVVERLTLEEAQLEDIMLSMRMSAGVALSEVRKASECFPGLTNTFDKLVEFGLVALKHDRYQPTSKGWLCGNEIFGRIWENAGHH